MTSRRAFIRNGIAVAAIAAGGPLARAHAAAARPQTPFRFLYDQTLAAARAFGAAAARRGAPALAIGSDVGGTWLNVIEPRLKLAPAALAGLTGAAPLFCLELLARDYGLRVAYRIEHAPDRDARWRHAVTGPAADPGWAGALAAAGADWAAEAAAIATTCAADLQSSAAAPLLDLAKRPGRAQSLFTWMLAPIPGGSAILARSAENAHA